MSYRIQVVDVRGIGWIPYRSFDSGPINAYSEYSNKSKARALACKLLFFSGNEPPPQENIFKEQDKFIQFLRSKNYRGAISVHNVEFYSFDNGEYGINFETLPIGYGVGYTPYRVTKDKVIKYQKGQGWELGPTVECYQDGVSIEHTSAFRIGKLGREFAKTLTGYEPPFAWLYVKYDIRKTGKCNISFAGSSIPSQFYYTIDPKGNSSRQYHHDMEKNSIEQILSMLEPRNLGENKLAQAAFSHQIEITLK